MPANLTPQYQRLEERYRKSQTLPERAELLDEMLATIPKHKGTEKLQAELKTKVKETKAELQAEASAPKKGPKTFRFPRQGCGQVLIVGAPNSGKSRILKELTKAEPEVAPYPFTTREPLPGMMPWEDVNVQLIDTPPITDAQFEPYLLNLVRAADAVVLAFDGSSDDAPRSDRRSLESVRVAQDTTRRRHRLRRRRFFHHPYQDAVRRHARQRSRVRRPCGVFS